MHQQHETCIKACNDCADACDMCASACLQEDDVKMMARCIALDIDCAQLCRAAAAMMARGSEAAKAVCAACAAICQAFVGLPDERLRVGLGGDSASPATSR